jgi:hypothetical protein
MVLRGNLPQCSSIPVQPDEEVAVIFCRGGDTATEGLSVARLSFESCNLRLCAGGQRHAMLLSSA